MTDLVNANATRKDFEKNQLVSSLETLTKSNRIIPDILVPGFYDVVAKNVWFIEDKYYCRGFDVQHDTNIDLKLNLRMKGYLSEMVAQAGNQIKVMGIMIKLVKLKSSLRQLSVIGILHVDSMNNLRDPGKVKL